jgi:transcriptional regulator with XRE-family HTH domain
MVPTEIDPEILEESALAGAQATIAEAIKEAELSYAEVARHMGCSRSFVSRMLSGGHNLTIRTMARALAACNFEVTFAYRPLEWSLMELEKPIPRCEAEVLAQAGTPVLA